MHSKRIKRFLIASNLFFIGLVGTATASSGPKFGLATSDSWPESISDLPTGWHSHRLSEGKGHSLRPFVMQKKSPNMNRKILQSDTQVQAVLATNSEQCPCPGGCRVLTETQGMFRENDGEGYGDMW